MYFKLLSTNRPEIGLIFYTKERNQQYSTSIICLYTFMCFVKLQFTTIFAVHFSFLSVEKLSYSSENQTFKTLQHFF